MPLKLLQHGFIIHYFGQANQYHKPPTSTPSPPPSSTPLPLSSSTPLQPSPSTPPPPLPNRDDQLTLDLDGSHNGSDHVMSQDLFQGGDVSIMPPILWRLNHFNTINFLQANQVHDDQLPPEAKDDNCTISHQTLPPKGHQHDQPPNQGSVIDQVNCK